MKKILIASINAGVRESLKLVLGENYELILCDDPITCPKILESAVISILFFDIDGQDKYIPILVECLSTKSDLKIITVVDHKNETKGQESVAAGANGYVIKPLRQDQVLSLCR